MASPRTTETASTICSLDSDSDSDSDRHSPRKRTKPLIPEPFTRLSISRQAAFLGSDLLAASWGKFSPNLNIPQYREQLGEDKQNKLDKRASRLHRRAIENQLLNASEFCWEADAWHNVFGPIRDDPAFRIDKRPYEFIEKDSKGQKTVKKRIPDATLGLRAYDNYEMEIGYTCTATGCEIDHTHQQPHKSLLNNRIARQMYDSEGGLIVDGVWGETNILFPFAVYEAKKKTSTIDQAKEQIYHACKTYLAMMDDLARDPADVTKYQSEESKHHQVFAFISCGSYWEVYTAWQFLGSCFVETIWEADIKSFSRAYDLICIIDQIHNFAITRHRNFVITHLEPWLRRTEELEQSRLNNLLNGGDFELYASRLMSEAEWVSIKEASQKTRNAKSAQTRMRNAKLKAQTNIRNTIVERAEQDRSATARNPKPTSQVEKSAQASDGTSIKIKRGRGRPRKVNPEFQASQYHGRLRKRKV